MAHQAFELELQGRPQQELMFFSVHGYWPEAAVVSERDEKTFSTHGLRSTVILERVSSHEDELFHQTNDLGSIPAERFMDEIACRPPEETAFILLHGCLPEKTKVTETMTRSFTTHCLKTTIILQPEVETNER